MNAAPTSTAVRRRSPSTKQEILTAAADLFAERGFTAVSVADIATRVGITGGAIYRHYPSKDAVLDAVLLDTIDEWVRVASEVANATAPTAAVVEASLRLVTDRPGQLATHLRERANVERSVSRELARRERRLFELWSAAMSADQPALTRADLVVRQQAINGVLRSLASRPSVVSQPRLRGVIAAGLVAVATAPPAPPDVTGPPAIAPGWTAPVPRREQIIAQAMKLFAQRGFHSVSMDDIGEAVGMAGPSLYEHVAGKTDILVDAYDRAGAMVVAGVANVLATATSADDALAGLVRSYLDVAVEHADLLVTTTREGGALPDGDRPRLARRRRDLHEQWATVLREVRDDLTPADARRLVRVALALAGALAARRRGASLPAVASVPLVLAFLLAGTTDLATDLNDKEQP